jgi:hypothetical protein
MILTGDSYIFANAHFWGRASLQMMRALLMDDSFIIAAIATSPHRQHGADTSKDFTLHMTLISLPLSRGASIFGDTRWPDADDIAAIAVRLLSALYEAHGSAVTARLPLIFFNAITISICLRERVTICRTLAEASFDDT